MFHDDKEKKRGKKDKQDYLYEDNKDDSFLYQNPLQIYTALVPINQLEQQTQKIDLGKYFMTKRDIAHDKKTKNAISTLDLEIASEIITKKGAIIGGAKTTPLNPKVFDKIEQQRSLKSHRAIIYCQNPESEGIDVAAWQIHNVKYQSGLSEGKLSQKDKNNKLQNALLETNPFFYPTSTVYEPKEGVTLFNPQPELVYEAPDPHTRNHYNKATFTKIYFIAPASLDDDLPKKETHSLNPEAAEANFRQSQAHILKIPTIFYTDKMAVAVALKRDMEKCQTDPNMQTPEDYRLHKLRIGDAIKHEGEFLDILKEILVNYEAFWVEKNSKLILEPTPRQREVGLYATHMFKIVEVLKSDITNDQKINKIFDISKNIKSESFTRDNMVQAFYNLVKELANYEQKNAHLMTTSRDDLEKREEIMSHFSEKAQLFLTLLEGNQLDKKSLALLKTIADDYAELHPQSKKKIDKIVNNPEIPTKQKIIPIIKEIMKAIENKRDKNETAKLLYGALKSMYDDYMPLASQFHNIKFMDDSITAQMMENISLEWYEGLQDLSRNLPKKIIKSDKPAIDEDVDHMPPSQELTSLYVYAVLVPKMKLDQETQPVSLEKIALKASVLEKVGRTPQLQSNKNISYCSKLGGEGIDVQAWQVKKTDPNTGFSENSLLDRDPLNQFQNETLDETNPFFYSKLARPVPLRLRKLAESGDEEAKRTIKSYQIGNHPNSRTSTIKYLITPVNLDDDLPKKANHSPEALAEFKQRQLNKLKISGIFTDTYQEVLIVKEDFEKLQTDADKKISFEDYEKMRFRIDIKTTNEEKLLDIFKETLIHYQKFWLEKNPRKSNEFPPELANIVQVLLSNYTKEQKINKIFEIGRQIGHSRPQDSMVQGFCNLIKEFDEHAQKYPYLMTNDPALIEKSEEIMGVFCQKAQLFLTLIEGNENDKQSLMLLDTILIAGAGNFADHSKANQKQGFLSKTLGRSPANQPDYPYSIAQIKEIIDRPETPTRQKIILILENVLQSIGAIEKKRGTKGLDQSWILLRSTMTSLYQDYKSNKPSFAYIQFMDDKIVDEQLMTIMSNTWKDRLQEYKNRLVLPDPNKQLPAQFMLPPLSTTALAPTLFSTQPSSPLVPSLSLEEKPSLDKLEKKPSSRSQSPR